MRDREYTQMHFAQFLKAMMHTLLLRLGIDPTTSLAMIDGDLKEMPVPQLCGKSTRHAMQTLGTEWGRDCIDKDFWVQATLRGAVAAGKAVISDVRFKNEAAAIKEHGGVLVQIVRDAAPNGDSHTSEKIDFTPDYTILNNGTIEELTQHILEIDDDYERKL